MSAEKSEKIEEKADPALKNGVPEELKNTDPAGDGHGHSKDSGAEPIVKSQQE